MFALLLAARLGRTLGELCATLGTQEFALWCALHDLHPEILMPAAGLFPPARKPEHTDVKAFFGRMKGK